MDAMMIATYLGPNVGFIMVMVVVFGESECQVRFFSLALSHVSNFILSHWMKSPTPRTSWGTSLHLN